MCYKRHLKVIKFALGILITLSSCFVEATVYITIDKYNPPPKLRPASADFTILGWDSANDAEPNPCYTGQQSTCNVAVLLYDDKMFYIGGASLFIHIYESIPNTKGYGECATIGCVKNQFLSYFPIPRQDTAKASSGGSLSFPARACLMIYRVGPGSGLNTFWPLGPCASVPPPEQRCDFSGSTKIDHGSLTTDKVSGATKSINQNIVCTIPGTVRVTFKALDGTDRVKLNGVSGVTARTTVNGVSGSTGVTISSDSSGVNVSLGSTLQTTGTPTAGSFNGSGVAMIEYL